MNECKRARVQASGLWWLSPGDHRHRGSDKEPGSIDWSEHERAWITYASRYGLDQSTERIEERGGFSYSELVVLLGHPPTTWQPRG
jgi:hypothetical protein